MARRFSDLAASSFLDGVYLTRWPRAGALLPPLLLLLGFLLGWQHPGFSKYITYTSSLPVMLFMLTVGSMGAGLGSWLGTGYVLGDLLLFDHGSTFFSVTKLLQIYPPLLLSYILLAQLIVLIPLASQSLRQTILPRLKVGNQSLPLVALPVEAALQASIQGFLVFLWVNSVPTLIRPVFTWKGTQPPVAAIAPLQTNGHFLIILAILLTIGRAVLEDHAAKTDNTHRASRIAEAVAATPTSRFSLPSPVKAASQALFLTFLLSGLLSNGLQAFCLSIVLFLIFGARRSLYIAFPSWPQWMARIPILLRLLVAGGLNFWIAGKIIQLYWSISSNTFLPILLSTGVGIILFSLLLPQSPKSRSQPPADKPTERGLGNTEHLLLFLAGAAFSISTEQPPAMADNCGSLSDCYHVIRNAVIAGGAIAIAVSLLLDFLPVIGDIKGILEGIRGRDSVTGEQLENWQRVLGAIPIIGRLGDLAKIADLAVDAAKVASEAADIAKAAAVVGDTSRAAEAAATAAKAADQAADAARAISNAGDTAKAGDAARAAGSASDAARAADRAADAARRAGVAEDTVKAAESAKNAARRASGDAADLARQRSSGTRPTKPPGEPPGGERTTINPNASRDVQRTLRRENESADLLAQKGYDVEQNPPTLPNGKNPDYRIDGKTFDNLAPSTSNPDQIRKGISRKVSDEQADRIILNMNDTTVELGELRDLLNRKPIDNLKEIIVVRDGEVIPFFP